jgi:hypothetical protein
MRHAADTPVVVPFKLEYGLIFLEVHVPGRGLALALLDTGANASAIDDRLAKDLPVMGSSDVVGSTGSIAVENVKLDGLRLGSIQLPTLRGTRRDLSGLLAPQGRTVDMILGSDALANLVVTFDFAKNQLEVARESPHGRSDSVPMILDNGIPAIEGHLGGVAVWLRIDTGASLFDTPDVYINIPPRIWNVLRSQNAGIRPSTYFKGTGANGQTVDLPVAPVTGATVGPRQLERVFVIAQPEAGYFADPEAKGFVSNNFLRRLGRVTLDYKSGRLR